MLWYGMACFVMLWYSVVWSGLEWYGIRYGMWWYGMVLFVCVHLGMYIYLPTYKHESLLNHSWLGHGCRERYRKALVIGSFTAMTIPVSWCIALNTLPNEPEFGLFGHTDFCGKTCHHSTRCQLSSTLSTLIILIRVSPTIRWTVWQYEYSMKLWISIYLDLCCPPWPMLSPRWRDVGSNFISRASDPLPAAEAKRLSTTGRRWGKCSRQTRFSHVLTVYLLTSRQCVISVWLPIFW